MEDNTSINERYKQKLDEYKKGFIDGFHFKPINPEYKDSSEYNNGYEEGEVKRKSKRTNRFNFSIL